MLKFQITILFVPLLNTFWAHHRNTQSVDAMRKPPQYPSTFFIYEQAQFGASLEKKWDENGGDSKVKWGKEFFVNFL
jgi:hypothetical protein